MSNSKEFDLKQACSVVSKATNTINNTYKVYKMYETYEEGNRTYGSEERKQKDLEARMARVEKEPEQKPNYAKVTRDATGFNHPTSHVVNYGNASGPGWNPKDLSLNEKVTIAMKAEGLAEKAKSAMNCKESGSKP